MAYKEIDNRYLIPPDQKVIWRYMTYEKFESLIQNRSLYFARTDCFDEYSEGVLTINDKNFLRNLCLRDHQDNWEAQYQILIDFYESFLDRTYISCWADSESERMHLWSEFANLSTGIAIRSNVGLLKETIEESELEEDVYISKITYIDPISGSIIHFNHLSLFTKKITDYKIENEIRGLIQRRPNDENPTHFSMPINPEQLIEQIYIPPMARDDYIGEIRDLLNQNDLTIPVQESTIEVW